MAGILIFLEHDGGAVTKSSLAALQAANLYKAAVGKDSISAVLLGEGAKAAATDALEYGVSKAFYSEVRALKEYLAAPYAAAFEKAFHESGADTAFAAATTTGKDFMPRVAVKIGAGQASDILAVNDDGTLKRPMYAGDVFADVEITTDKKIITARPSAFSEAAKGAASGQALELAGFSIADNSGEFVSREASGGDRPDLTDASVVISGGRALQSEENFEKYIYPLADALGAAVGASRAAVDSGYAPNDWQVGQTGKIVAPDLYIAIGISGAIQHLAGMKDSKVIVAINKDEDAPIFEMADYGLVADLYEVVPELTEAINNAKS